MRRSLLRCAGAVALVAAATLIAATPASAATPRNQACVGQTFSSSAHAATGAVGSAVRDFARDKVASPPGLGDGIQLVQAGLLPDSVADNACND